MKVKKAVRSSLSDSRESANPRYDLPAKAVVVCAADQIQLGCVAGKASGFYIEKKQVLKGADAVQRICLR